VADSSVVVPSTWATPMRVSSELLRVWNNLSSFLLVVKAMPGKFLVVMDDTDVVVVVVVVARIESGTVIHKKDFQKDSDSSQYYHR